MSYLKKGNVRPRNAPITGFSLVELSIVLVILGLLVGGVMSGQSLIKAAELRSVTSEFQQYQTAVNVFKDKYFQLPGDFDNATAFWAADSGCGTGGVGSNTEPGYPLVAMPWTVHATVMGVAWL